MHQLQGQDIEGVMHQHLFPELDGAKEVAVDPGAQGPDMAALAVVRLIDQGFCRLHASQHVPVDPGLHGLGQHACLEAVTHDELRMCRQNLIHRRNRVADESEAVFLRPIEGVDQFPVIGRYRHASAILSHV